MSSDATVQLLTPDGTLVRDDRTSEYLPWIEKLPESRLLDFHRQMVVIRRFDTEAGNLQRQGQLALWIPSIGQEAAQVGSGYAALPQDHIFPTYREHVVGRIRGLDLMRLIEMLRGLSHGGWVPAETGNFHLYAIVLGSQTLHATGFAMGIALDRALDPAIGPRDPEKDAAVLVYFGDGASSEGDVSEAMVFAASFQAPQVFFLQNNGWAISVPVERQSRTPLYLRGTGFGIPSVQIDGNDVLASYAVTSANLLAARSGEGPRFIEALTYRMGAHTTSDDPTKYRESDELAYWSARDPIARYEAYLRGQGVGDDFFAEVAEEAEDLAADVRARTHALQDPPTTKIFEHVYTDAHPLVDAQREWLAAYGGVVRGRSRMTETLTLAKAINLGLARALADDPKVLLMGEDIATLGGVFRVTEGLKTEFGVNRVIDTPLAESAIVGTAIGLAMRGYRPVCEIQFDGFIFPAFDQITSQLAKLTYRHEGAQSFPVVIRVPYGGHIGAVEHHQESPEAYFAHTPGLRVVSPATPQDGYWMIQQAIASNDPVMFFEPKSRYWQKGEVDRETAPASFQASRVVRVGSEVTLVGHGAMVAASVAGGGDRGGRGNERRGHRPAFAVADRLRPDHRVRAEDRAPDRRAGAPGHASVGSEIAATVAERAFYSLEAPVLRVSGFDTPFPPAKLEGNFLPDADRILEAVDRALAY